MASTSGDGLFVTLSSLPDLSLNQRKLQLQLLLDNKERQLQQAGTFGQCVLAQQIELEEKIRHLQDSDAKCMGNEGLDAVTRERYRELAGTIGTWDLENARLLNAFNSERFTGNKLFPATPINGILRDEPDRPKASSTPVPQSRQTQKRADDVEFAFEIGSALLTEVRRLQDLLGERDKVIQDIKEEKEDLEKRISDLHTTLRSQERSSDKFKEENRNPEVTLQELRTQLSDSQNTLQRLESERKRFTRLLEGDGNAASSVTSTPLLREWAKVKLTRESWKDVLASSISFTLPRLTIYRVVCEHLETIDRITDAVECFLQMTGELGGETSLHGECMEWALDFSQRSRKTLEHLGDTALDAQRYDEAISHYSTALSLNSPCPQWILIKRSKARVATGSWKEALDDANRVVALDPSSPWGYEMKHTALHKGGEYESATDAFEMMLSKIAQSPDPDIRQRGDQYISPSSTRVTIRKIVQQVVHRSPRVLIDTTTGRLHNRAEQASAFESLPVFSELVSSMTTRIDHGRIKHEVRQYFRYVMLSHKWEDDEPLFQQVAHITVYDLDMSPAHDKLQTFCKIVRDAGFNWAWSDTCCINKSDHFVLQEALVAMFKWYQGSAMMIVFLRGVRSSQRGALVNSIWNTRAWTLQEYIASKIIHFYTEDWTPYLDLELSNHKESSGIISEMELATGVSAQHLLALRPGLTNIREKLRLASTRKTTLLEDAAYSLLGIFSVSGIPAIYGEGEGALGRLLAHVLTGSGDVSILAWTGESGGFNSCLPAHITVFSRPATSHLPPPILDSEMERIIIASHSSPFDLDVALMLHDRLRELPAPWFAASRMKLPCIVFSLPPFSSYRTRSGRIYRANTNAFGMLEIKTRQDLSRMKSLYLIHPWLDTILDHEETQGSSFMEDGNSSPPSPHTDDEEIPEEEIDDDLSSLPDPESPSHPAPQHIVLMDRETRARRLVARLRQPFGALMVALASTGRRAPDYRRVAADSMITVRFQESVSLADLFDNVRTLDIL